MSFYEDQVDAAYRRRSGRQARNKQGKKRPVTSMGDNTRNIAPKDQ